MRRKFKKVYKSAYTPEEKLKALNLWKHSSIQFVAKRYHCSFSSLFRWKRQYDGTIESLENKFSRKDMLHPNRHTDEEVKHIQDIEFIHDHTCYVAAIMIKYIYDKYSFNDLNLFLDSMLFKSYDDVVLNMVLPVIRSNYPDKLPIFWNNCACSQKLSVSFINMHYMKFNTPDLAYNLSVHNSEFWKCNQMIISKIKKLSLQKS